MQFDASKRNCLSRTLAAGDSSALDPFSGKGSDLLRVRGRLSDAPISFGQNFPIILGKSYLADLQKGLMMIRKNFYIPTPQQLRKTGIRGCAKCSRMRVPTVEPQMAMEIGSIWHHKP